MGPVHHVLGKKYDLGDSTARFEKVIRVCKKIAQISEPSGIISSFEILRPGENNGVILGHKEAIAIHDQVNSQWLKIHFDILHSRAWKERPSTLIMEIGNERLGAIELHGTNRAPAGSATDQEDWDGIYTALQVTKCELPIITETFGKKAQEAVPALGENGIFRPPYGAEALLGITGNTFRQHRITVTEMP